MMEHYLDPHMEQADHAYNLQSPQDIPAEDLDGMPPWPDYMELEQRLKGEDDEMCGWHSL